MSGMWRDGECGSKARPAIRRGAPRRRARVRRSLARISALGLVAVLASLVGAASAGAATLFSDGFESGNFSAWSAPQTKVGGTATVQSAIVSTGTFAARLSETATAGSKAYVRKKFNSAQQDLSASGDFRVLQQGAAGQNVPFFRFLDPTSARVVSIYRQNGASGKIWVTYGGGFFQTTKSLPLNTWGTISLHVITNGAASTVEARLNGSVIYQATSANLGTAGVQAIQIGNDTTAEAFTLVADTINVHTPPDTTIKSGPSGLTNDPTPTFAFSSEPGASFQCKIDSGAFAPCASPKTTPHLTDGPHTFSVRATDSAGSTDPTPASRSFTVKTASVSVSGSTLTVSAASGARDNLAVTRPSPSTLRVTDLPGGAYTGSGVHTGAGCTQSGDNGANCTGSITLIQITAGDQADQVVNSTPLKSTLDGGAAPDTLVGGSNRDTLTGAAGADVMRGMNGSDVLMARDLTSDKLINCDGGTTPGPADKADLDLLPRDPNSVVKGCEAKTRH